MIYLLKLHLLSNVFDLTDEEKTNVSRLCVFICLLYVRPWFESPLPCLAPLNDLSFASKVLQYRMVEPVLAFTVLQSIKNHLWYLTPQLVVLSLADTRLPDEEREEMARTLHSTARVSIDIGKPAFPEIDFSGGAARPSLSLFISEKSWLIFDFLGLTEPQDWLLHSCKLWDTLPQYGRFVELAKKQNLAVT